MPLTVLMNVLKIKIMDDNIKNKEEVEMPGTTQNEWQAKAEEYLAGWKRSQADLQNYRKDENKRVEDFLKFGSEAVIISVIDRVDDLARALEHVPPDVATQHGDWLKGIQQVLKTFEELLKKWEVQKIASAGETFNPLLHEAVQIDQEGPEMGEKVIEEYRSGYMMHGKVIRPARVKISK